MCVCVRLPSYLHTYNTHTQSDPHPPLFINPKPSPPLYSPSSPVANTSSDPESFSRLALNCLLDPKPLHTPAWPPSSWLSRRLLHGRRIPFCQSLPDCGFRDPVVFSGHLQIRSGPLCFSVPQRRPQIPSRSLAWASLYSVYSGLVTCSRLRGWLEDAAPCPGKCSQERICEQ